MDSVKLKAASMHANMFYPSVGEIKKELRAAHDGVNKETKLWLEGQFVRLELKSQAGPMVTLLVPVSNFTLLVPA